MHPDVFVVLLCLLQMENLATAVGNLTWLHSGTLCVEYTALVAYFITVLSLTCATK